MLEMREFAGLSTSRKAVLDYERWEKTSSMIMGIGVDITEIDRMREAIDRRGQAFIDRVLTPGEQAYCLRRRDPVPCIALRFAAKEAVAKAFTLGLGRMGLLNAEVFNQASGEPRLRFHGWLRDWLTEHEGGSGPYQPFRLGTPGGGLCHYRERQIHATTGSPVVTRCPLKGIHAPTRKGRVLANEAARPYSPATVSVINKSTTAIRASRLLAPSARAAS